jgi:hypothetical protein
MLGSLGQPLQKTAGVSIGSQNFYKKNGIRLLYSNILKRLIGNRSFIRIF